MKKKKGRSVKLDTWEKSKIYIKSTAQSRKGKRKKRKTVGVISMSRQ